MYSKCISFRFAVVCVALLCGAQCFDLQCPKRMLMRMNIQEKWLNNQNEMRETRDIHAEHQISQEISAGKPECSTINGSVRVYRENNKNRIKAAVTAAPELATEQTNQSQAFHIRNWNASTKPVHITRIFTSCASHELST